MLINIKDIELVSIEWKNYIFTVYATLMKIMEKKSGKVFLISLIIAIFMIMSTISGLTVNLDKKVSNKVNTSVTPLSSELLKPSKNFQNSMGVNPLNYYSSEPAPMGLADYGVINPGLFETTYAYNTTSFLGGASINSLSTGSNNTTINQQMTFQFNINLAFYNGAALYVYWVQDVAFVNTSNNQIYFIDNIWNMSSSSANMQNSTFTGNGTIGDSSGTYFYYAYANSSLPGNFVNLKYPSSVQFMMNSTVKNGVPEVNFMYNDGYGWQTYDNVLFSFVTNLSGDLGFVVDGQTTEPDGYSPYDAELTLGGPGGGSSTTDVQSNVNLTIQYWNGHNYQEISNAFNFGSHTAETIGNVISNSYYFRYTGNLFEEVTAGSGGSLQQVYTSSDISLLNISMPLTTGTVYVNGGAHSFVGGNINLTLGPGSYQVEIYSNSLLYKSLTVNLTAGEYLPLEVSESFVTFTATGLPQGTVWWVNFTGHSYSSSTNTISFYESNGTYSYTLSTDDKNYMPSVPSGAFVVDGNKVSQSAVFVPVLYNVTFKETGLPSGMSWSVALGSTTHSSTNSTVSFKEMNGTYRFTVSNLTLYYTNDYSFTTTINGKNVTETVDFLHYAYITGTLSPGNATLKINDKTVSVNGGVFNISVVAGNYTVTASENGYTSYSNNVTLSAGGVKALNITLKSNSHTSSNPLSPELEYIAIGVIVLVIAGAGGIGFVRMRRK